MERDTSSQRGNHRVGLREPLGDKYRSRIGPRADGRFVRAIDEPDGELAEPPPGPKVTVGPNEMALVHLTRGVPPSGGVALADDAQVRPAPVSEFLDHSFCGDVRPGSRRRL